MFFINPYWPLAALDAAEQYRQARVSALRLAACFNPALAWWLLICTTDQGGKKA